MLLLLQAILWFPTLYMLSDSYIIINLSSHSSFEKREYFEVLRTIVDVENNHVY